MYIQMTYPEYAAMIRYIVNNEKNKNHENWKIPAIKALRDIRLTGLREAKMLVESVYDDADPVVNAIKVVFGEN